MIGYKGFDKDFCCRGFQYKVGETYHFDGNIKLCESGFHFCDTPLAVWHFYPPNNNRFALVEATGNIISDKDEPHKFCTNTLHIVKELSIDELIKIAEKEYAKNQKSNTGNDSAATNTGDCSAATNTGDRSAATNTGNDSAATNTGDRSAATNTGDYSAATNTGNYSVATNTGDRSAATNTGDRSAATNTGDRSAATNTGNYSAATNTGYRSVATNTGDCSAATNTGDYSAATNTGNYSVATNTGYRSAATVSGKNSIAIVTGANSKARGALGCWLVLSEWKDSDLLTVKAFKVDGKLIKPDTFYTLKGGAAVIAEQSED